MVATANQLISLPDVTFEFTNKAQPAGTWQVSKVWLREQLNEPFTCRIELTDQSADGDSSSLPDIDPLLGDTAVLYMSRLLDAGGERELHGIVRQVRYLGVHMTHHYLEVELVPPLWALGKRVNSRIFSDTTVPDIVSKVINEGLEAYGSPPLKTELHRQGGYPRREYCVQYNESDLDFIQRLLAEEGIGLAFLSDSSQTMLLFDDNSRLPACRTMAGAPVMLAEDDTEVETVQALSPARGLAFTSAVVRDYDWTQPTADPTREVRGTDDQNRDHELFVASPTVTTADLDADTGLTTTEHGRKLTALLLEEDAVRSSVIVGTSNVVGLIPGAVLEVESIAPQELSGKYLIIAVDHEGTAPKQGHHGIDNRPGAQYKNTFSCIPFDVTFRPMRRRARPVIFGPQTAVVVGPSNEEVYTDKHGRIKVKFHWDRLGTSDGTSSCWIRVAQSWAGSGYGVLFIPRVGMEVVVSFLDGNPDRPLVTGCVYNGRNTPAQLALPHDKTSSGIVTRSSKPGGAQGENRLVFEDTAGSEQIEVHAQKDLRVEVGNTRTKFVGHGAARASAPPDAASPSDSVVAQYAHIDPDTSDSQGNHDVAVVMGAQKVTVKQDREVVVEGASKHFTGGDASAFVQGANSLHVAGDAKTLVEGGQQSTVARDIIVKSVQGKLEITAATEISLKVGPSVLTLKSDGSVQLEGVNLAIKGGMSVQIKGMSVTSAADMDHNIKGAIVLSEGSAVNTVKGGMVMLNP